MPQWWDDYPSGGPIKVDGGIKARSTRGAIATTWWSQRFIGVLEEMQLGGRLTRGKAYARSGQVLSLAVSAGKVLAKVQGSRPKPYDVKLIAKPLTAAQWDLVVDRLAGQALYVAKLLAGEMPPQIEDVFTELDIPLFPRAAHDLPMHCSCPDWASPCKHVAAVCYLLAERFDEDPFLILQWRGRGRDDVLGRLRGRRPEGAAVPSEPPLAGLLADFYTMGQVPALPEPEPSPVLGQLDAPVPGVRGRSLGEALAPLYDQLTP